jgi:hypothetical protein
VSTFTAMLGQLFAQPVTNLLMKLIGSFKTLLDVSIEKNTVSYTILQENGGPSNDLHRAY